MTSDDSDNVTSSTVVVPPPKRAKKNKHADLSDDSDGVSSNFHRKKTKKRQNSFEPLITAIDNHMLYEAMLIKHDDVMIQFACKHCNNRLNLPLMEWSEAVLIQLCDLKTENNYIHNSWAVTKDIVENNQWSLPISYNIRKYASAFKSLAQLLEQNHLFKINEHSLKPTTVFVNLPTIRYNVLEKYKIDSQKISVTNKFPDLKLKIK